MLHESDAGHRLAEGTVKRLTGGDRLKARRMREDFWSFDPSHTFVMLTNHKPGVSGTDEGIWRRLRLVPFEVSSPPADATRTWATSSPLEADAVLAWLVAGYLRLARNGLAEPEVTEATQAYRAESDPLGRFISECCLCMPPCAPEAPSCSRLSRSGAQPRRGSRHANGVRQRHEGQGLREPQVNGRMLWHGIGLADDDSGEGGEGLCQYSRAV